MSAHIAWSKGGQATLLHASAEAIRLRSTVPSPPGSRIEGHLLDESAAPLRVKIHGCKRQDDGSFVLDGRPLDLTRETRERLAKLVE